MYKFITKGHFSLIAGKYFEKLGSEKPKLTTNRGDFVEKPENPPAPVGTKRPETPAQIELKGDFRAAGSGRATPSATPPPYKEIKALADKYEIEIDWLRGILEFASTFDERPEGHMELMQMIRYLILQSAENHQKLRKLSTH